MIPVVGGRAYAKAMFESSNGGHKDGFIILNFLGSWWDQKLYPSREAALTALSSGYASVGMRGAAKPKIVRARQSIAWGEAIR